MLRTKESIPCFVCFMISSRQFTAYVKDMSGYNAKTIDHNALTLVVPISGSTTSPSPRSSPHPSASRSPHVFQYIALAHGGASVVCKLSIHYSPTCFSYLRRNVRRLKDDLHQISNFLTRGNSLQPFRQSV